MYNFKKFMAIACSATMLVSTPLTAFATDPTSTAGDGTILAYSVDTVTVPTSVKLAFNPMGLSFDTGAAAPVTSQIVSLNYGIASSATMDRTVTVKFKAVPTNGTEGEDIEFVDDIKKAQAYVATGDNANTDGAKKGEYKVYLAVAASAAAPKKAADTPFDASTNAPTADLLSNVDMTAATKGLAAFEDGENAEIAYVLDKAVYGLKDGETPDFDTDNEALAGMMELKTLGGVVGFTFTGAMNPDADWTKAKTSAIVITPTYKIADATGDEELLGDEGGYKQIGTTPAVTTTTVAYDATAKQYKIDLPSAAADVTDITNLKVNDVTVAVNSLNSGKDIVRVARADVRTALTDAVFEEATDLTFTFTFGGTNYKAVVGRDG